MQLLLQNEICNNSEMAILNKRLAHSLKGGKAFLLYEKNIEHSLIIRECLIMIKQ